MNDKMKLSNLTKREKDIAHFIAIGYSYKEISKELFISLQVVKNYATRLYKKLDIAEGRPGIKLARWVWEQENEQ